MPAKFMVAYLTSFLVRVKIRTNRNPRYERYHFVLLPYEELLTQLAPRGLFFDSSREQCAMYSLFGSFEPLARYIDTIDADDDEPIFGDAIHLDWLFRDVAPELIVKSFSLTGCNPRPKGTDGYVSYWGLTVREEGIVREVTVAIDSGESELTQKCDYLIRFRDRTPIIRDLSDEGGRNNEMNMFFHPALGYSNELRDYLQIVFNKM